MTSEVPRPPASADPLFRRLHEWRRQSRGAREAGGLIRSWLRVVRAHFEVDAIGAVTPAPGGRTYRLRASEPADHAWDLPLLAACASQTRWPLLPSDLMVARLPRRGRRSWGVVALATPGRSLPEGIGRALQIACDELSEALLRLDDAREEAVRARIDDKIIQQLPSKDLYYQLLDGLHQLTHYDHSASLWLHEGNAPIVRLVAEQIQWSKAKSERIGESRTLSRDALGRFRPGDVRGFRTVDGAWRSWGDHDLVALPAALYPLGSGEPGAPAPPGVLLLAALGSQERRLGVLAVASQVPDALGEYECEVVHRLAPLATVAIQRSLDITHLRESMIAIDRRQVLADVAAGVAHDLNNQLGSLLPTVQALLRDVRAHTADETVLLDDLEAIESSTQSCVRTVKAMLQHARGGRGDGGPAHVKLAIDRAIPFLKESLERQGIALVLECPPDLPAVAGHQSELDRVVLNLATNAREAMTSGGRLRLVADTVDGHVRLCVEDTGHGIAEEDRDSIFEAFFTTKPHGTGLGLNICRRIVDEMKGSIRFETETGVGTRFIIELPQPGV